METLNKRKVIDKHRLTGISLYVANEKSVEGKH